MLTRPLGYKGPTDHLSQLFSYKRLYQGWLLLADDLMDWQHLRDENRVQGVFIYQQKLVKASLSWPLKANHANNYCGCEQFHSEQDFKKLDDEQEESIEGCEHLAALAIESKVQLDRLPPSLKQQEQYQSEREYFARWLSKQHHDPFPNMARHRVVYILDQSEGRYVLSVHKAYLTQQQTFQIKAPLPINTSVGDKLPKFVSLTDQEILVELQKLNQQVESELTLESHQLDLGSSDQSFSRKQVDQVLLKMVDSGRAFWRAVHRAPLSRAIASSVDENWLAISANVYLSRSESKIYAVQSYSQKQLKLLRLLNSADFDCQKIVPKLEINTQNIGLVWRAQNYEFDSAEISFVFSEGNSEPDLEIDKRNALSLSYLEIEHLVRGDRSQASLALLEHVSAAMHLIDSIEGIYRFFEPPIARQFDPAARYLDGDISHWFPMLRGLQLEGWQIEFAPSFKLNQKSVDDWYSRVQQVDGAAAETHWFELEVGVRVDGEAINILPFIVQALKQGQLDLNNEKELISITLDDGRVIGIRKQRVEAIVKTLMELSEAKPLVNQKLHLPQSQLVRVNLLEKAIEKQSEWMDAKALQDKAKALAESEGVKPVAIPENVNAELREYQKRGVDWLQFLSKQQIGGILADDMGLGKTLQTLTHIQIEKNAGRMRDPVLIVAPTSLLGNWLAEAKKFTPDLSLLHWAGHRRRQNTERLTSADIIVTSYGLLLRDFPVLSKLELYLLVLDEAQAIKNSSAKVSKIAFALKSKLRLCLTGTPLENHLGELWSLFHFLMPGLLGDHAQFKRLFQIPIEKEQDWQRQQQLAQRIAPFMLRRTKDKVAADLPAKTEISEVIELSESQADLYETVRMSMLEEVQKAMTQNSKGGNQLIIGNALLRLRQICCHPDLVDFGQDALPDSAKLTWLQAVLPELVQTGSRVLIFSSFTSMLSIISETLDAMKIAHLKLTGQTRNRTALVEEFQSGSVPVFLISLKAGGAGLNLTEADTVIHFDPWWNPAAENQASDRAHRIGQDKPVFVYKLIAKGTVEERIHQMQQHKSQMAQDIYRQNELIQQMEKPDWEKLLAPIGE